MKKFTKVLGTYSRWMCAIALIAVIGFSTATVFTACASTGGSSTDTTPGQETIVFFGASQFAGTIATGDGYGWLKYADVTNVSPPAVFQKYVNIPVINVSKGDGRGSVKGLSIVKKDVLSKNPRIVVIAISGNDYLNNFSKPLPLDTTKNNLQKIIDILNDGNRKLYLVNEFPDEDKILEWEFLHYNRAKNKDLPVKLDPNVASQYIDMYKTLASSNNLELIEGLWDGVLDEDHISADRLHPNAAGYEIMAANIFKAMKPYLEANNLLK